MDGCGLLSRERIQHAAESRHRTDGFPKQAQPATSLLAPASQQPVGEYDRIHGAGACAGDADDVYVRLLQQSVEHTPGEGPVRAAALQCECDFVPLRPRPVTLFAVIHCRLRRATYPTPPGKLSNKVMGFLPRWRRLTAR